MPGLSSQSLPGTAPPPALHRLPPQLAQGPSVFTGPHQEKAGQEEPHGTLWVKLKKKLSVLGERSEPREVQKFRCLGTQRGASAGGSCLVGDGGSEQNPVSSFSVGKSLSNDGDLPAHCLEPCSLKCSLQTLNRAVCRGSGPTRTT